MVMKGSGVAEKTPSCWYQAALDELEITSR